MLISGNLYNLGRKIWTPQLRFAQILSEPKFLHMVTVTPKLSTDQENFLINTTSVVIST